MKKYKIGIQLYSLRGEMERDFEGTLKRVSEIGYDYVEFAGFYDKSAEEIKAILDKYKLKAVSAHQNMSAYDTPEKLREYIEYAKVLGIKFIVIPYMAKEVYYDREAYSNFVQAVAEVGAEFAKCGIALGYHNHDFEFEKIDGEYIIDRLYRDVPESLLQPQLDLCWVNYGGESPERYIRKYAKRMSIIHFKDFVATSTKAQVYALIDNKGKVDPKDVREAAGFKYMPLGQGKQDWSAIFEALEESNVEYIIYEKDQWYDGDPVEQAKESRDYLKNTFDV